MKPGSKQPQDEDASVRDLAKQVWDGLPPKQRSVRRIVEELAKVNVHVGKSTISRWAGTWSRTAEATKPIEITAKAMLPAQPQGPVNPALLEGVPQALQDALGLRALHTIGGAGLDRVENCVIMLVNAIAAQADNIAKQILEPEAETETTTGMEGGGTSTKKIEKAKAARAAIAAVSQLAGAMQTVTASRVLASVSHRNFAEGDMLMAQGRKADAEAQSTFDEGRAGRAKEIDQTGDGAMQAFDDADGTAEDEAVSALRDVEASK